MANEDKKLWFKRRRYGWGWVPVRRQGWIAITAYLAFVILGSSFFGNIEELVSSATGISLFILTLLSATMILISICYRHGPVPKWRWGKKPGDNPKEDF